jgi:hypothetical protein
LQFLRAIHRRRWAGLLGCERSERARFAGSIVDNNDDDDDFPEVVGFFIRRPHDNFFAFRGITRALCDDSVLAGLRKSRNRFTAGGPFDLISAVAYIGIGSFPRYRSKYYRAVAQLRSIEPTISVFV